MKIVLLNFFRPRNSSGGKVSLTAMFLRFSFAAVFFQTTFVGSDQCPGFAETKSCHCAYGSEEFHVNCTDGQVDEIGEVLASTKQYNRVITLQDVRLSNLTSNFLRGQNVQSIVIHNCSTSFVDQDAFSDMAGNLEELRLTHNALESVPSLALDGLVKLQKLYLDSNRIQKLYSGDFKCLSSLRVLSLEDNWIKYIDKSDFLGLGSSFKELKLGGNEMTFIPHLALSNQSDFELHLNRNRIVSLAPENFDSMSVESLKNLNLANNRIQYLPAEVFSSLKKIFNLDLSANGIETIHASAFRGLEGSLVFLTLRDNRLEKVPSAAVRNMRMLTELDLSNNKILQVQEDDFLLYEGNLTVINLKNNSLKHLDPKAFANLKYLKSLYLESNQLQTLSYETISPVLDKLKILDIKDNPLHCDCNLFWFQDWMKNLNSTENSLNSLSKVKCITPEAHAKVNLADIPKDELICGPGQSSSTTTTYPNLTTIAYPDAATTAHSNVTTTANPNIAATELQNATTTELQNATTTELQNATTTELQNATTTELQNATTTELQNATTTELQNATTTSHQNATTTAHQNSTTTADQNSTTTAHQNATITAYPNKHFSSGASVSILETGFKCLITVVVSQLLF